MLLKYNSVNYFLAQYSGVLDLLLMSILSAHGSPLVGSVT